jgi:FkbM family methyltransferase
MADDPRSALTGVLSRRAAEAMARAHQRLATGRAEEAISAYDEVLALMPAQIEALVNKGAALRRVGRRDEAVSCYMQAISYGADQPALWINAANALIDLRRTKEASVALQAALRRAPLVVETWLALVNFLLQGGKERAAEMALRRVLALAPGDVGAINRLAGLASQNGSYEEALELFERARALGPLAPSSHSGFAQTLISMGRLDEAERHLRRALELNSDDLDAHLGLARLLLLKGDLAAGWVEYEWRRQKAESKLPKFDGKEWDGSPIDGKTLLVYSEQGFGDVLQFARYIPLLAKMGARVIFAVPAQLERIMQGLPGAAMVTARMKPMPAYDFHVPLLSVPKLTGIAVAKAPPGVAYLKPPAKSVNLPVPLGTKLKIGVVWAGSPSHSNDRNRSLTLDMMLPVAALPGIAVYSLQAGPRVGDLAKRAHSALVFDLSAALKDFTDTAAIVAQLDLIVCADTSIAHLAGAFGRPVWVLMPFAPDWRWMIGREDSPWYPNMRMFRQSEPGRWDDVVARIVSELEKLAAGRPASGSEGSFEFVSVFMKGDGTPRFKMSAPRVYLADPGIRFLLGRERAGIGYEYATRCFIDAHLEPDDLFIDVGAHWGIMSLQAATRWPGRVQVLAIEPLPANQAFLSAWVESNDLASAVEIIEAAAGAKPGRGDLRPESTMGHILVEAKDGPVAVATIDQLLAERPKLAGKRVIVKVDVEGREPEVVTGMDALLKSGKVAALIWERGTSYDAPGGVEAVMALRRKLDALGFTAWRFESEDQGGALVPFVETGWTGNVFELAPGVAAKPVYAAPRLAADSQPADPVIETMQKAVAKAEEGGKLQTEGKLAAALSAYGAATLLDQRLPDLYNNLGVAMRNLGRLPAAEAAYRRAARLRPDNAGTFSNLGNTLREMGKLDEAEAMLKRAVELRPNDPHLIYNLALVPRDDGRPEESGRLLERALALNPNDPECEWDLALSYLQAGDYARGMPAYESRWKLKRSPPRKIALPRWTGEPLNGKSVFLHDEQGFGDVLMFARFIPEIKRRGAGRVVLECQPELLRLMADAPGVDEVVHRGAPIQACDLTLPLLSLPGLLGVTLANLPARVPYLKAPKAELGLPQDDSRLKLGLVWAGKPTPRDRSCPLDELLPALWDPRFSLFALQAGPRAGELKTIGADILITDLSPRLHDFAETASLLSELDLLVTIDTSVAHLAGALAVPTFLLLRYTSDWRWFDKPDTSPWYPTFKLFRQDRSGTWDAPLARLSKALESFATQRKGPLRT